MFYGAKKINGTNSHVTRGLVPLFFLNLATFSQPFPLLPSLHRNTIPTQYGFSTGPTQPQCKALDLLLLYHHSLFSSLWLRKTPTAGVVDYS